MAIYIANGTEFLMHHGVKGQKWGVRRLDRKINKLKERIRIDENNQRVYKKTGTSPESVRDSGRIVTRHYIDPVHAGLAGLHGLSVYSNLKKGRKIRAGIHGALAVGNAAMPLVYESAMRGMTTEAKRKSYERDKQKLKTLQAKRRKLTNPKVRSY